MLHCTEEIGAFMIPYTCTYIKLLSTKLDPVVITPMSHVPPLYSYWIYCLILSWLCRQLMGSNSFSPILRIYSTDIAMPTSGYVKRSCVHGCSLKNILNYSRISGASFSNSSTTMSLVLLPPAHVQTTGVCHCGP